VAYSPHGIVLQSPPSVAIFELCRYLADVRRDGVLATVAERRVHVPPELQQLLVLDNWRHPNLAEDEYPRDEAAFRPVSPVAITSRRCDPNWSAVRPGIFGTLIEPEPRAGGRRSP
jgi:hypothetical protein